MYYIHVKCQLFLMSHAYFTTLISRIHYVSKNILCQRQIIHDAVKLRGFVDGQIVVLLRYLAPKLEEFILEDEVLSSYIGQDGTER